MHPKSDSIYIAINPTHVYHIESRNHQVMHGFESRNAAHPGKILYNNMENTGTLTHQDWRF